MFKTAAILAFLALCGPVWGQSDSVKCDAAFRMSEGIYLSYEDFRNNHPLSKDEVRTDTDKEYLDFFGKTLEREKLFYTRNGASLSVDSKNVWGFYQNNVLHVNYAGTFYKVPLFGSISYLVATVEVVTPAYYSIGVMGGGVGATSVRTKEVRNFLINFYDGVVTQYSTDLAEFLLSRDAELYKEYLSLKPRKRKEQVSMFIRRYNEAHPVYFLKR